MIVLLSKREPQLRVVDDGQCLHIEHGTSISMNIGSQFGYRLDASVSHDLHNVLRRVAGTVVL